MFGSFVSALSGLNAAGAAIDVIGNDLANLNTTGYKGSSISFEDVVADVATNASRQIGSGVATPLTFKNFLQGSIQTTGGAEDAAIQGDGFFIVRPALAGAPALAATNLAGDEFTRAGNFQVDQNGILTTATGERVQGWPLDTTTNTVNTSQPIGDIVVPVGTSRPAVATTSFSAALNLDSAAATGTTFAVPINVYDSLGNSHVVTATFIKDLTLPNTWNATVSSTDPTVTVTKGGPFVFTFNSDGSLDTVTGASGVDANGNITGISLALTNGATTPQTLSWTPWQTQPVAAAGAIPAVPGVGLLTQFAQTSASSAINQNGSASAQLTSVSITDGGSVLAQYSDGTQQAVAQVALASVRNPDSLIATGNNNFQLGEASAIPVVGVAGSGGRGQIVGGSLESSNVDIATEFTQLIIYQRTYSANARVITTTDQVTQETINLIQA